MIRDFEYFAPKTLKESLALLDEHKDDCKIIAGGQSMLVLMKQGLVSPEYIIDIKGLSELDFIRTEAEGGLTIGALTTHRVIEKSPVINSGFSVLAEMERRLASIQTRNWGTIGGNLCHGDPAGDPAPVLIALNSTLVIASQNSTRSIPVEDFYSDYLETVLECNELLTEIQIPGLSPHTGTAYSKFNLIESDMGTVGVAVSITLNSDDRTCNEIRIALGASAPTPMRAKQAEGLSSRRVLTDALIAIVTVKQQGTLFSMKEFYEAMVKVSELIERINDQNDSPDQSSHTQVVALNETFLNSVKIAVKPGLELD